MVEYYFKYYLKTWRKKHRNAARKKCINKLLKVDDQSPIA